MPGTIRRGVKPTHSRAAAKLILEEREVGGGAWGAKEAIGDAALWELFAGAGGARKRRNSLWKELFDIVFKGVRQKAIPGPWVWYGACCPASMRFRSFQAAAPRRGRKRQDLCCVAERGTRRERPELRRA